jgi:putative ABC transport system permease protein
VTLARISVFYLRKRALGTALNVALLGFGIAAVTLLLLTSTQLEERIRRDARGIDLVVGAPGSQTQLILSAVHGLDAPAGSIGWNDVQEIASRRGVAKGIPLAMGDHYYGFRIVGTTHDYPAHYGAVPVEGALWRGPLEAVFGADVAARLRPRIGSRFDASHSVPGSAGLPHPEASYRVVGILGRTGTVIDRLVLTDVASYWKVHPARESPEDGALVREPPIDSGARVTALLLQYDVSHAANEIPYVVNQLGLQAATPAHEAQRLHGIISVGIDLLRGFAIVLMLSAALSIFIALYNGLNERRYDIAVMRTLGATRADVMRLLLFEGLLLALAGAVVGLALGHLLTTGFGIALSEAQQMAVSGWTWSIQELWIVALALLVGFVSALLPAWRAHEVDIAATLARG